MYSLFRQIRHIGVIRAWYAFKADHRVWKDEHYPPPGIKHSETILLEGSRADIYPVKRVDIWSYTRNVMLESRQKLRRLKK